LFAPAREGKYYLNLKWIKEVGQDEKMVGVIATQCILKFLTSKDINQIKRA